MYGFWLLNISYIHLLSLYIPSDFSSDVHTSQENYHSASIELMGTLWPSSRLRASVLVGYVQEYYISISSVPEFYEFHLQILMISRIETFVNCDIYLKQKSKHKKS